MAISFQGLSDRGKGDLLFDKGKTGHKQVSWNEVEVRFEAAWHCCGAFWGLFRRLQKVTKHSSSSLTKPHRLNLAGNSAKRAGTGTAVPKPDYSD